MNHLVFNGLGDMIRHGRGLPHVATALAALDREQMAFAALFAGNLTCACDLESLGDPFVRLALGRFSCFSWHVFLSFYDISQLTFHFSFLSWNEKRLYLPETYGEFHAI